MRFIWVLIVPLFLVILVSGCTQQTPSIDKQENLSDDNIDDDLDVSCTPQHEYMCNNGSLYWYDSCGNVGDLIEECEYGCIDNECSDYCISHYEAKCYTNKLLFWYDSCGNREEVKESCPYGCKNDSCLEKCEPHFAYTCYKNDIYWMDTCGEIEEMKEDCEIGCETTNSICMTPCENNCDDNNPCTEDICYYGDCSHNILKNGTECGDDKKCVNDECIECIPDSFSDCLNEGISTNAKLYWFDSCGFESRIEDCDYACFDGDCINFDEIECIDTDDMYENPEFYPGTTTIRLIENTSYIILTRNDVCHVHDTWDDILEYSCGTNDIVSESIICQNRCTDEDPAYCNPE